jgi:hypothetical protein
MPNERTLALEQMRRPIVIVNVSADQLCLLALTFVAFILVYSDHRS